MATRKDLRSFLSELETHHPEDVVVVRREVDPDRELAAVVKGLEARNPVVIFERVKGSEFPVVCGLHAARRRVALALGSTEHTVVEDYLRLRTKGVPPERLATGPVKEVILRDDQIDLYRLPIVTHAAKDAGAYIGAGVGLARDPVTGVVNTGMYRLMRLDRQTLSIHVNRFHHLFELMMRAEEQGRALPIAIAIGHHPAFQIASQTKAPITASNFEEAGALLGEPLRLVPAETCDLEVPADAEFILEGEILPGQRIAEGPFGEFTYYYGSDPQASVLRVTAITHRADAIYLDVHNVHSEHRVLWICPMREANILSRVREILPRARAVHIPPSGAGLHVYVSIQKLREGDGKNAILAALAADHIGKHVIVVDDDVDVYDEAQVLWAVATRFQGDRDLYILPGSHCTTLDPSSYSLRDRAIRTGMTTKMGLDATRTIEIPFPERADAPDERYAKLDIAAYLSSDG